MVRAKILVMSAMLVCMGCLPSSQAWADYLNRGFSTVASHEFRAGFMYREPTGLEKGVDLDVEVLAHLGWTFEVFDRLAAVRPLVGASISTQGDTHFGYAQLALTIDVTDQLFIEGAFGGTVHNGDTNGTTPNRLHLGCPVLFRESGTIGYRVTERYSIMATVSHSSNAGLCSRNRGMTNLGARVGFSF